MSVTGIHTQRVMRLKAVSKYFKVLERRSFGIVMQTGDKEIPRSPPFLDAETGGEHISSWKRILEALDAPPTESPRSKSDGLLTHKLSNCSTRHNYRISSWHELVQSETAKATLIDASYIVANGVLMILAQGIIQITLARCCRRRNPLDRTTNHR